MRYTITHVITLAILLFASCSSDGKTTNNGGSGSEKLKVDVDSIAYIIGMNIGENLNKMDSTLNIKALCRGIEESYVGNEEISFEAAKEYYLRYTAYSKAAKIRQYEEQFLKDILVSNRSYARTTSGLTYTVSDIGDEELTPRNDKDSVTIIVTMSDVNGKKLIESDTLRSVLGDLIASQKESVRLIGKGGKISAWAPASESYGENGNKMLGVAPNSTLLFDIELLDFWKYSYAASLKASKLKKR